MKKVFKKRDIVFGFCTVLPLFLISCASMGVSSKGKDYFIGKSEKTISDYFGGATVTIPDETGEYDKISWFTNREYVVTLTKDIIKQYKSTNTKTVFKFLYYEYPDGCRFSSDQKHYSLYGADIKTGEDVVTHNAGDNAYVNNQIAVFNNNLKTLGCINSSQENAYLSNSKIGDTFYVSDVETKIGYSEKGYLGNPSGNVTWNILSIKEVNVILSEEKNTVQHFVGYSESLDKYIDDDGNSFTEEEAVEIINRYIQDGFSSSSGTSGISILAYFKDGKVAKVEDYEPDDDD